MSNNKKEISEYLDCLLLELVDNFPKAQFKLDDESDIEIICETLDVYVYTKRLIVDLVKSNWYIYAQAYNRSIWLKNDNLEIAARAYFLKKLI